MLAATPIRHAEDARVSDPVGRFPGPFGLAMTGEPALPVTARRCTPLALGGAELALLAENAPECVTDLTEGGVGLHCGEDEGH